jgi:hypothetical protein
MRRGVPVVAMMFVLASTFAAGATSRTVHDASGEKQATQRMDARLASVHRWGYVRTASSAHAKWIVDAAAGRRARSDRLEPASTASATAHTPKVIESFEGPHDTSVAPGNAVGAIGPARFVNLVDERYAIFDRTVSPPAMISSGTLLDFAQATGVEVFQPNVIWDPGTQRFYYAMDEVLVAQQPASVRIDWGFSMTATPNTTADWCHYATDFGIYGATGRFPDFPRLGDTADFVLIGVNSYLPGNAYLGSDVAWITKPPPGSACPPDPSFLRGVAQHLKEQNGSPAFSPVPADQIDGHGIGYVVASSDLGSPGGAGAGGAQSQATSSDHLSVFTVTRNADGTANIPPVGSSVPVKRYKMPKSAPQMGSSTKLDTLDGRLTNAQEAIDPETGKRMVYTQHTVRGGAGAEVRAYKVDPATLTQTTVEATSDDLFVFDGAVSSDRAVDGSALPAAARFGESIVVGFDTSSATTPVTIRMIGQIDSGARSKMLQVRQSSNPDADPFCQQLCPWGRWASAEPDPAMAGIAKASHGVVWLTGEWVGPPSGGADWRSWNWSARP